MSEGKRGWSRWTRIPCSKGMDMPPKILVDINHRWCQNQAQRSSRPCRNFRVTLTLMGLVSRSCVSPSLSSMTRFYLLPDQHLPTVHMRKAGKFKYQIETHSFSAFTCSYYLLPHNSSSSNRIIKQYQLKDKRMK